MAGQQRDPPRDSGFPVAVLSDQDFDATAIDLGSVVFRPGGASPIMGKERFKDIENDGDIDALFYFRPKDFEQVWFCRDKGWDACPRNQLCS